MQKYMNMYMRPSAPAKVGGGGCRHRPVFHGGARRRALPRAATRADAAGAPRPLSQVSVDGRPRETHLLMFGIGAIYSGRLDKATKTSGRRGGQVVVVLQVRLVASSGEMRD